MYVTMQKRKGSSKLTREEQNLIAGIQYMERHPLFGPLPCHITERWANPDKTGSASVTSSGAIYVNGRADHTAGEWAYLIAHCALHLVFGHFDLDKVPGYEMETDTGRIIKKAAFQKDVWNLACDVVISRFLAELHFGQATVRLDVLELPKGARTEEEWYQYFLDEKIGGQKQSYGTATELCPDMEWLGDPIRDTGSGFSGQNRYTACFAAALREAVTTTIAKVYSAGEGNPVKSPAQQAAAWFVNHYPLLGGLASSFQIIEDAALCRAQKIQVAAVSVEQLRIYINPAMRFCKEEWQFVLAHEYLHAGLCHPSRCGDRNFQIWNIACDFVINGWLTDMQIGKMPAIGILYDPTLSGLSAETIYDSLCNNLRKAGKLETLRGYGRGDMLEKTENVYAHAVSFEEICREALLQGLEYQELRGRGLIPAGLIEEIRSLAMPPVPWEVKLAEWFQERFPIAEWQRTYARASRRQGATPEIPRPGYRREQMGGVQKTFGVIVDTSGSVSAEELGKALGAIASYAAAREVPLVRVIYCDATAYDAGYLSVEELAGSVQVKGRGGTRLQPGVDKLEQAQDFPEDGPILLITDGGIESRLVMHHEHAYLLPKGSRMPFQTTAPVFYYS